ncbi:MAG TPA: hypothetical protein VG273_03530 [Bryobacteraceae bacterium]|jgi:hypothetical protein|nr:hypothetical protein [Bryobacteraceae bacterium]
MKSLTATAIGLAAIAIVSGCSHQKAMGTNTAAAVSSAALGGPRSVIVDRMVYLPSVNMPGETPEPCAENTLCGEESEGSLWSPAGTHQAAHGNDAYLTVLFKESTH